MASSIRIYKGGLPQDVNGFPIQRASKILTQDGQSTPEVSPVSVNGGDVDLVAPDDSVLLTLTSRGGDVPVGDNPTMSGSGSGNGYYTLQDGDTIEIELAAGQTIYLKQTVGANVDFFYSILDD